MNDAVVIEEEAVIDEVEAVEAEADTEETEDVTEESTGDEESPDEESSASKKEDEGKDKIQARIDEITKLRRTEERQRIAAQEEARELREKLEALQPKQPAGMTLADFEYDEAKFTEYLGEQAAGKAREAVRHESARVQQQQKQADFSVKESEYAMDFDDYHSVTRNQDLKISPDMVAVAQGSDNGPGILYYLGKNPEVSERLANMHPLDMAREMGRIESNQISKPASITKAPKPPAKLKGENASATIRSDSPASDSLSTEEWRRRELKRLSNRK